MVSDRRKGPHALQVIYIYIYIYIYKVNYSHTLLYIAHITLLPPPPMSNLAAACYTEGDVAVLGNVTPNVNIKPVAMLNEQTGSAGLIPVL